MKKLTVISVLCASGLFGGTSALSATENGGFTVDVSLTSKCLVTSSTPSLSFTYEAFGAAVSATAIPITFKCTRGIPAPTVAFDVDTSTDKISSATGLTATGGGVISGLKYTLAVAANSSTDSGTPASSSNTGTAKLLSYSVSGIMEAGQAGTCATSGTCTATQARSLIVTY